MTEKDYNPEQKQAKAMQKQKTANKAVVQKAPKVDKKDLEKKQDEETKSEKEDGEKVQTKKTPAVIKEKKESAVVRVNNLPVSTKHSVALCNFIRSKKLGEAISNLEDVLKMKRAVPMKGEIPHKKGKGMMSGRFPKKASESFLKVLKSLASNAVYNGLEEPVIVSAVANLGARPYGRFGSVRKKRTHLEIIVKDEIKKQKEKKK